MATQYIVLARAFHFGACLLFFSIFAFDRFVAVASGLQPEAINRWRSRSRLLALALLAVILISGLAWFILVAVQMGGQLQFEILKTVWAQTQFGTVWEIRLVVWLVATFAAALACVLKPGAALAKTLAWLELSLGGLLLGSLAWAGHGQETSNWHLFADVLHLLAAGFWPAGLLPFALLLRQLRHTPEPGHWNQVALLVRRFSAISIGIVVVLAITGWVNGWYLVGSFANLVQQPYGRWLLAKIILFILAVAIGAVNLLRLKPRLIAERPGTTASRLQFNVWLELLISALIVGIVAVLGIMPPAS